MSEPILWIIVPCYNEEAVLPITAPLFLQKLSSLIAEGKVAEDSRILFVNDGSKDKTWEIICGLSRCDEHFLGIAQSRNRGHQNALLAGLMEAKDRCEITITIDCDGQDDMNAMDAMVEEYKKGCDIVYGVRSSRKSDSFFKRSTARSFYRLMSKMGVEMVYDHADYRRPYRDRCPFLHQPLRDDGRVADLLRIMEERRNAEKNDAVIGKPEISAHPVDQAGYRQEPDGRAVPSCAHSGKRWSP